jgi:arabinogalactan oligomer/maltooligosaccharide transport system permease protein
MTQTDVASTQRQAHDEGPDPRSPRPPRSWAAFVKWALLLVVVAFAGLLIQRLLEQGLWLAVVGVAFVAMAIVVVYGVRRAVPLKYLMPGLLLLLVLQVWPIVYTVATAFTNYGDGHRISKQESVDSIIANSVREVPGTKRYKLSVAVKEGTDIAAAPPVFLLTDASGATSTGDLEGLEALPADGVEKTATGKITAAPGYTILSARQVNARKDLDTFAVPTADGGGIKRVGLSEAFEGKPTVSYDKATDTLEDSATGKTYVARNAQWAPQDGEGEAFAQGWKEGVGAKNFTRVLTDSTLRDGFVKIFAWNMFFAVFSVLSTFLLGMLLALLLNDDRLKGKAFYRSLLILPYAIPSFITALVWASMFNQDFGLVNSYTGLNVDWLGNPWAAKAAILVTNLWLGFPYMFIVCTGALQSIPGDVREAAKIDGANAFRTLRSITMPLLLVAVGPLLIASFAFNFNNFTLIYLLTGGGPFDAGDTSIGSSDLLITYAYRLAFSGTTPNYGFAAAVSIFIFAIVAVLSYSGFRRTKSLEEVN